MIRSAAALKPKTVDVCSVLLTERRVASHRVARSLTFLIRAAVL